jgi:hypothetical protein
MTKHRRSMSALIGGGTLALTSIVGLGTPAQAATGAVILVPITFSATGAHVLPVSFKAGDCHQVGQNEAGSRQPSYLVIDKSATSPNLYTITWNATLYTDTTQSGDVWHQKFVFRSTAGPVTTVLFDGPWMVKADQLYPWQASKQIAVTPDQANSITFVDWIGDC